MVTTPDFEAVRETLAQDVVVVCPRVSWSGYPIKLLNAMAAGRPIVACRSAAHPIVDGESGVVVYDNDEEAFAQALIRLMQSPEERSRLGNTARAAVENNHRPEHTAAALDAAFPAVHRRK
jgi:glycosyltransferase involved in cell wall biosynthesis